MKEFIAKIDHIENRQYFHRKRMAILRANEQSVPEEGDAPPVVRSRSRSRSPEKKKQRQPLEEQVLMARSLSSPDPKVRLPHNFRGRDRSQIFSTGTASVTGSR